MTDQPDLIDEVAKAILGAASDGSEDWDALPAEERDVIRTAAKAAMAAQAQGLIARGFRLVEPGAVLIPKSDEEAGAMLRAIKDFAATTRRKGKLVGGPGLIVPPGARVQ
jgi:hypothetical protein